MKKTASANGIHQTGWYLFFALTLLLQLTVFAQTPDGLETALPAETKVAAPPENKVKLALETCKIKNFGMVTDQYFRGAQPKAEEYAQLAALGVKTVIDLRDETAMYAKTQAEAAGIHYLNLPMSDTKYPPQETVQRFLELAKDPANFPIYVHCHGGRHRTGVVTAVYRMTVEGWDIEKVYGEMKDYDFYTRWGHKQMKVFVFDYWKELQAKRKEAASTVVPTEVNR